MVVNSRGRATGFGDTRFSGCGLSGQGQIAGRDLPGRADHANERLGHGLVIEPHGAEKSPMWSAIEAINDCPGAQLANA